MRIKSLSVLAAVIALWSGAASAADSVTLTNAVFQEVEVAGKNGKKEKKRVPATKVTPGTEVIYVITYKNAGAEPALNVVINNPVPPELEFKPGSAAGAKPVVSVDGGQKYGELAKLKVIGADGKSRPAQGGDVTHLRWSLNVALKPGDEGKVTYRARLK